MFWMNENIQAFFWKAEKIEIIKNYKIEMIIENKEDIKELIKIINEEYPFLTIKTSDNNITIINEGKREEGIEIIKKYNNKNEIIKPLNKKNKNIFQKLIELLIEKKYMSKVEKELKKEKYKTNKLFNDFQTEEITIWQKKYMKKIKEIIKKKQIKDKEINKILKKIKINQNSKILKDENNLRIFLK